MAITRLPATEAVTSITQITAYDLKGKFASQKPFHLIENPIHAPMPPFGK